MSGLDIGIIYRDGAYLIDSCKQWHKLNIPWQFYAIATGKPVATTGQCVAHAKQFFNNSDLANKFKLYTSQLNTAIINNDLNSAKQAINDNHELLCKIGVVPSKTQLLINKLNKYGVAAKISGAGSIHGDSAGMLICLGDKLPEAAAELNLEYFAV